MFFRKLGTQEIGATKWNSGGLKKVGDVKPPCMHPEHNPPTHIVLEPGHYEYTCPSCGEKTRFIVSGITCGT